MAGSTPILNQYTWEPTDEKLTTFLEYNNNAVKLEDAITKNPSWVTVAFQNAWSNLTGYTCSYRKSINGKVSFKGAMTGGTSASGVSLFTLPTGYRPPSDVTLPVFNTTTTGVANGPSCITIEASTGIVKYFGSSAARIYLDGLEFMTS